VLRKSFAGQITESPSLVLQLSDGPDKVEEGKGGLFPGDLISSEKENLVFSECAREKLQRVLRECHCPFYILWSP
jgi:hypothetical protein